MKYRKGKNEIRRKMKYEGIIKKIAVGMAILLVTLLTYKFIAWNSWKVKEAVTIGKRILNEPSAVNLKLLKEDKTVFQKSFTFNPKSFYIINSFDITPYITKTGNDFKISLGFYVNSRPSRQADLHRLDMYDIVNCGGRYFVFTRPGFPIETIPGLEKSMPSIINSMSGKQDDEELVIKGKQNDNEINYTNRML
jgi:hypothetical protein